MKFSPFEDSLWYATAAAAPETHPLGERTTADVCIVGGGYTGLTTALELIGDGIDVVLLEAEGIGFGGSGRNAGHCTPTFHHLSMRQLRRMLGEARAARLIERQTNGANMAAALIEQHGIDCEWSQSGYVRGAPTPAALPELERIAREYNAIGKETRLLDRKETAEMTGSERFHGAWFHPEGGHLNPLGYVRGLARAAIAAGVRVHTHSPVDAITPEGTRWAVATPTGTVLADKVICGTGAYTVGAWKGLDRTFRIQKVFVAATEPLSDNVRRTVLPRNTTMHDGRGDIYVYKYNAEGRIVASMFPMGRRGRDEAYTRQVMSDRLRWLHPEVGAVAWPYFWWGELDMQQRTIPRLFNLAPGVVAALGFSGRGVPTGTMIGGILADWARGVPNRDLALEPEPLTAAPYYMKFGTSLMLSYYRWRDNRAARRQSVELPPHA